MAMSSNTLRTGLLLVSGTTEASARSSWSLAWATYFGGASANGVSFTTNPATVAAARAAMETAMVGLSSSGLADDKVQAGIIAWWDYLVANDAAAFAGAFAITAPTNLAAIAANLVSIFAANQSGNLNAFAACGAIATSLHGSNAGGTVVFNGDDNTYVIA